jgi:protein-disulfide isomerase
MKKKNINLSTPSQAPSQWPIRQIVLGIVLFVSGVAVGYTARDLPAITEGMGGGAAKSAGAKDDPSWGPVNAKVTVVEFADFECPYCRQWYTNVYQKLYDNYKSSVRFVYRDYPLPSHPNAQPAANAANCAGAQGKYWEYFSLLFGDARGLGDVLFQTYAREAGLNMTDFNNCVASNKYAGEISLDMKDAEGLGVNGVPAFFVNDRFISGMQPYETFRDAIEAELDE